MDAGPSPHRSQAFFERYAGSTTTRQMPLQRLDDPAALPSLNIRDVPLARGLMRAAFRATGFTRYHRTLSGRLDAIVESSHQISATGPIVAATMAMADLAVETTPFARAAAMLKASWDIHAELHAGLFPPDQHNGLPLEMRQYLNLFGTSTVLDGGVFRLFKTAALSRVLVIARGMPYVVDAGPNPRAVSVDAIAKALETTWNRSEADSVHAGSGALGLLSCLPLASQGDRLRAAVQQESNSRTYDAVKNTFVTLCLDLDHRPRDYAQAARLAHSGNCANRWFHASLQLVVFGNAKACAICDFNAGIGGNTMMRVSAEIQRRSAAPAIAGSADALRVDALLWDPDPQLKADAGAELARMIDARQQATFELAGRGRAAFAARGMEPVPAFAIAVQLAVKKLTGRFARVRQFVSQANYRAHNVALALVSTPEVSRLIDALTAPGPSTASVRQLFRAAVESQRRQNRQARSYASVARSLQMFRAGLTGARARYVEFVLNAAFRTLRALHLYEPLAPTDVVISHPELFPEVPIMGRPGIRLPYVGCFGVHYLMWDDRTTVTLMPSTKWTIPNATLAAELEACMDLVRALADAETVEGQKAG